MDNNKYTAWKRLNPHNDIIIPIDESESFVFKFRKKYDLVLCIQQCCGNTMEEALQETVMFFIVNTLININLLSIYSEIKMCTL